MVMPILSAVFGVLIVTCALVSGQVQVNVGRSSVSAASGTGKKTMRMAPTREQVLERKRTARKAYEGAGFQTQDAAQAQTPAEPGLLGASLMISDGKRWTVLPKRAVLRFSDEVKPYIKEGRAGELVTWQQFQAANSAWIRPVPVSEGLLSGKTPVSDEMKAQWRESKILLVSTYQNNPISLPLPTDPKSAQTTPNPTKP